MTRNKKFWLMIQAVGIAFPLLMGWAMWAAARVHETSSVLLPLARG
jgi:hypothetical protein